MAGSRDNFFYTDDAGNQYILNLDRSNTLAINDAAGDIPDGSVGLVGLPRNIKPRAVFYSNQARTRTIRVAILNAVTYSNIVSGVTGQVLDDPIVASNPALTLERLRGETRSIYKGRDSGLTGQ